MEELSDFDKLILSGVIHPAALDPETGEMLYSFSEDLEKTNPQLHKIVLDNFLTAAMRLWELGFISMDVTSSNPMVSLTKDAFNQEKINNLTEDERFSLNEIKRGILQ